MLFSSLRAVGFTLVLAGTLAAQTPPKLSAGVRAFVKVDAETTALRHVRVIDGTGAPARENQTLVFSGGKITALGDDSTTSVPANATVLDLAGSTVIPGIVGMHEHMYYPTPGGGLPMYGEHATSFPRLYLAGGVTTMRTTGSVEPYTDLELKRKIDEGTLAGPSMRITGPYLEGEGAFAPQMHQLRDAEDARRMVEFWMDAGATSFKAYMNMTPEELAAVVKAAHARGAKVTGHLGAIGFREAAAIGIDNLEHGLVVDTEFFSGKKPGVCPNTQAAAREMAEKLDVASAPVQAMIQDLVARKVAVTSTLPVFETFVPGRAPTDARILDAMTPQAKESYLKTRESIAAGADKSYWPALFAKELQFEREFVKAGGLLLAGLDPTGYGGVIPGFGDQREIELLVEAGFTPVEAIQIATSNGARFLGELEHIGTLAVGKEADIVVLHGDPSTNIADIEKVELVFKDGVGFDSAKLIESVRGLVGLR
ncbi:MAG TPA: amidohydrolase family protein [Planctomycetota bacterium]|nr:amidohydrolase family protein [Planctomycetota bacterium]